MLKYCLKRLGASLITLVIIISVVFILVRQMPIEGYFDNFDKLDEAVIEATLQKMGLRDPIFVQLKNFFVQLLHGDLGTSVRYRIGAPIAGIIAEKAPISAQIGLSSMAVALVLGIPLGAAMARSKSKFWDKFGTLFIVLITAVPSAVYYIFIQMYATEWFHIPMLFDRHNFVTWLLPIFSMALGNIAYYAMWLRRYMVDEMNKDYVRLARAKGVPEKKMMMRHVFRNAFVPMIQYIPSSIHYTIGGSIYVESLYSIPGMGGLLVEAIQEMDNSLVQVLVILYSTLGVLGVFLGDILMVFLDPRIRLTEKEEG